MAPVVFEYLGPTTAAVRGDERRQSSSGVVVNSVIASPSPWVFTDVAPPHPAELFPTQPLRNTVNVAPPSVAASLAGPSTVGHGNTTGRPPAAAVQSSGSAGPKKAGIAIASPSPAVMATPPLARANPTAAASPMESDQVWHAAAVRCACTWPSSHASKLSHCLVNLHH